MPTYEDLLKLRSDSMPRAPPCEDDLHPKGPPGSASTAAKEESRPAGPRLSLEQILHLQEELRQGFAAEAFQSKLKELEARKGKAYMRHTPEHTKLFLSVQNGILPKYGFEEGQKGVVQMLVEAANFNDNADFQRNRLALNQLIGMSPLPAQPAAAPRARPMPSITEALQFQSSLPTASDMANSRLVQTGAQLDGKQEEKSEDEEEEVPRSRRKAKDNPGPPWTCRECGFDNTPGLRRCEFCDTLRGTGMVDMLQGAAS